MPWPLVGPYYKVYKTRGKKVSGRGRLYDNVGLVRTVEA